MGIDNKAQTAKPNMTVVVAPLRHNTVDMVSSSCRGWSASLCVVPLAKRIRSVEGYHLRTCRSMGKFAETNCKYAGLPNEGLGLERSTLHSLRVAYGPDRRHGKDASRQRDHRRTAQSYAEF